MALRSAPCAQANSRAQVRNSLCEVGSQLTACKCLVTVCIEPTVLVSASSQVSLVSQFQLFLPAQQLISERAGCLAVCRIPELWRRSGQPSTCSRHDRPVSLNGGERTRAPAVAAAGHGQPGRTYNHWLSSVCAFGTCTEGPHPLLCFLFKAPPALLFLFLPCQCLRQRAKAALATIP